MIEQIKNLSEKLSQEFIDYRRYFHKHPELSKKEFNTSKKIIEFLEKEKITYTSEIAGTGIVAIVEGKNPLRKCIALRADMDALPILEQNDLEYKSCNVGVMHACGHDVHMACLMGAAKVLNTLKDEFEGTVKFLFQPSEESFPGGAIGMIEQGVLDNPNVSSVFGQHVLPGLEAGKIGLKAGMYMASTDEIYLTVKGKGGHGATPELNIDPVVIASQILIALQQVVSRYATPAIPTTLSFGRFIADGRTNIIPNEVIMEGTLRTFDEEWRLKSHKRITDIAEGIARSMGARCEVRIEKGYPFLVNDDLITSRTKSWAIQYLGKESVVDLDMRMTAEDFAYFSHQRPSCFFRLGVADENGSIVSNLHTPDFNIDEKCIQTGLGLMAWIAINELSE